MFATAKGNGYRQSKQASSIQPVRQSSRLLARAIKASSPPALQNSNNKQCAWNSAFHYFCSHDDLKNFISDHTPSMDRPVTGVMKVS
jgi:hypothetical protein